ncbi:MAG: hypothetical protein OJF52_000516 [Nitrospira sp.]|nr:MAG: hypothetical protein OJF52_000516 [Nitrospira sp.]
MKKIVARKTVRGAGEKLPSRPSTTRRTIGPTAHTIKRKVKNATAPFSKQVKKTVRNSKAASKVPAGATRKAKKVGRAVGTLLGKAIGKVEQAVARVMKSATPSQRRNTR